MKFLNCWLAVPATLLWIMPALADDATTLPPRPPVEPLITYPHDLDSDLDGVDDALTERITALHAAITRETDPERRAALLHKLQEPVGVELLFAEPVTAGDLETFRSLGGTVDYVYRHVSYGWGGKMPLGSVLRVPGLMGRRFLCILMNRPMYPDLDEATRTGRVRPVWVAGFAGSTGGFRGSPNVTVAIIDTGVDGTHTDLSGRMLYWKDWFNSAPTPVDYDGHGTHCAGIAVGSGAALGASPSTLRFTDSSDLSSTSAGSFKPYPLHLPAGSVTMTLNASWLGGGNGILGYAYGDNYAFSYTLGTPTSEGKSPRTITASFTATTARHYSSFLTKKTANDTISRFAIAGSVTYAGVGDGFNTLSGVAPGCYWVGHKVYANDGSGGDTATVGYALDECVAYSATYNIKVVNVSLSTATPHTPIRNKVNTCARNGLLVTVSAGNNGPSTAMTDPARAALALTTAASSDANALTIYSSTGNFTQEDNTDYKPDLCPPGGSRYHSYILAPDANQSDAASPTFSDMQANDYSNRQGTSMAAAFAAGAAALVIQALEARGLTWNFFSDEHPRLVKMLLCATASETNANREGNTNNPTLGRAATPRDMFEGYGLLNTDAAVEAAYQSMRPGETISGNTTGGAFDRRAWARNIALIAGSTVRLELDVPSGADYDLYLYSGTPDEKGNPVILAASTAGTSGADESIEYIPGVSGPAFIVVKRVSGSGGWTLSWVSTDGITVTVPNGGENWRLASTRTVSWSYTGNVGTHVQIDLLKGGSLLRTIAASAPIGTGGSGSFEWAIPTDLAPASDYRIRVTSTSQPSLSDTSDADFALDRSVTAVTVDNTSGRPGENVTLRATLWDGTGNGIGAKELTFAVEGTDVGTASTASDGRASLTYRVPDTLGVGAKNVRATFSGDSTYEPSEGLGTLTVNPSATWMSVPDRSGTITEIVTLRGYVYRSTDNAPLVGRTVTFAVDGTEVGTGVTGSSGRADLNWVISEGPASRTIGGSFAGDTVYTESSASGTLTCLSWGTKMATFDRTVRISGRTELKARLVRSDNVPLYNKRINFYVDGTFVIWRPTNIDGYASYPFYDVPDGAGAGVRTILSEWPGNAGYAAVSRTAKLTVLKAIPYIWVMPRSVRQGDTYRLYCYFRRLYDYQQQRGKTLAFSIDGTWIADVVTGSSDSDGGVARYHFNTSGLSKGEHIVRCTFAGDAWVDAGFGEAGLTIY